MTRAAAAIAGICLMFFLAVSTISPLNGEDYALSLLNHDGAGETLAWIADRIALQVGSWNARLGEQLAIVGLNSPSWLHPALMTAVVAVLAYFCMLLPAAKPSAYLFAFTLVAAIGLWPRFEFFFWRTINFGYAAPLAASLALIVFTRIGTTRSVPPLFILGLLCGASFESLPPAIGVYVLLSGIDRFRSNRRLPLPHIAVASGLLIGWLWLMTSPSTALRSAHYQGVYHVAPSASYYLTRLADVAIVFWSSAWPLLVASATAAWLIWRRGKWDRHLTFLCIAAAASVIFVAAAPYTEPRAFGFAWAVALCLPIYGAYILPRPAWLLGAAALAFWPAVWAIEAYSQYASLVAPRDAALAADCSTPVPVIETNMDQRIINVREDWVRNNAEQVARHYGC